VSIRLADANRAIRAVLSKAKTLDLHLSVTVCDCDGRLVAFQRMDGAFADNSSIGKALASIRWGRPSGDQSIEAPAVFRPFTLNVEGAWLLRRPGGLPIFRAGQLKGALGVSGAPSEQQDEECALAGIVTLQEEAATSKA
jgi:glc operon protein GlcG